MKIDFSSRYQNSFGFITANISNKLSESGFSEVLKDNSGLAVFLNNKSSIFDEITLRRDTPDVKENYKFGFSGLDNEADNIFASPPMLSLKNEKNLTITNISDSDFEVIERYGIRPWEITWRGLLIDMENHDFPLDKLEKISKIFDYNNIWNVESEILNKIGIYSIYIRDICIDFVEGFEDTIAYSFTMRQIKPIEVQLIN